MRAALLFLIAIVSFYFGMSMAQAFEIDAWDGTSYSRRPPNGIWFQAGMPYKYQLAGDSKTIALRSKYNDWLNLEMNYTNFGQIGGSLTFVSDENYSGNPDDPCRHPCEAPRSATWKGKSKGLGLSLLPTYKHNGNELGLRIGVMKHITETRVVAQNFDDNYVLDPTPSIGYYNMSHRGFSWLYGVQMKISDKWGGQLRLIYMHAPDVRAGYDGWQRGVKDIHLSYRLEF